MTLGDRRCIASKTIDLTEKSGSITCEKLIALADFVTL